MADLAKGFQMFCTQFVQFSILSQSNLQRVTFCTQTGSCHSGGCIDPENAKVSTACSSTFYVPTSTLNLHPSIETTPQVPKWFTGGVSNSLLFGVIAGDVWQSLRRSLVPLMLMYAQSGQIQQHAIARPFHPVSCSRTTAHKPFPNLWKAEGKWGEDTVSRRILSRPLFERLLFGRWSACEFNRRNERGDDANPWFIVAINDNTGLPA